MNVAALIGRICSDPELRYSSSGIAVCNVRVAVERQRKAEGQPDADFLNIIAFGKTGEFVSQYLDRGAQVSVEGRIQSRKWQTNDGQNRESVEIVANSVQALETKAEAQRRRAAKADGQANAAGYSAPQQEPPPVPAPAQSGAVGEDEDPFGDQ